MSFNESQKMPNCLILQKNSLYTDTLSSVSSPIILVWQGQVKKASLAGLGCQDLPAMYVQVVGISEVKVLNFKK